VWQPLAGVIALKRGEGDAPMGCWRCQEGPGSQQVRVPHPCVSLGTACGLVLESTKVTALLWV